MSLYDEMSASTEDHFYNNPTLMEAIGSCCVLKKKLKVKRFQVLEAFMPNLQSLYHDIQNEDVILFTEDTIIENKSSALSSKKVRNNNLKVMHIS